MGREAWASPGLIELHCVEGKREDAEAEQRSVPFITK